MKRFLFLVLLLLQVGSARAGIWTDGTQIVTNVIWVPDFHGFYVPSTNFQNPQGCTIEHQNLYLFDSTLDDKTVDRLYAQLLLALSTQRTVYVWLDGCQSGTPKVKGLQIN